jgi:hypothetical protein
MMQNEIVDVAAVIAEFQACQSVDMFVAAVERAMLLPTALIAKFAAEARSMPSLFTWTSASIDGHGELICTWLHDWFHSLDASAVRDLVLILTIPCVERSLRATSHNTPYVDALLLGMYNKIMSESLPLWHTGIPDPSLRTPYHTEHDPPAPALLTKNALDTLNKATTPNSNAPLSGQSSASSAAFTAATEMTETLRPAVLATLLSMYHDRLGSLPMDGVGHLMSMWRRVLSAGRHTVFLDAPSSVLFLSVVRNLLGVPMELPPRFSELVDVVLVHTGSQFADHQVKKTEDLNVATEDRDRQVDVNSIMLDEIQNQQQSERMVHLGPLALAALANLCGRCASMRPLAQSEAARDALAVLQILLSMSRKQHVQSVIGLVEAHLEQYADQRLRNPSLFRLLRASRNVST